MVAVAKPAPDGRPITDGIEIPGWAGPRSTRPTARSASDKIMRISETVGMG